MTKEFIKEFAKMVVTVMFIFVVVFTSVYTFNEMHKQNIAYAAEIEQLKEENEKLEKQLAECKEDCEEKVEKAKQEATVTQQKVRTSNGTTMSRDDIELIALCTMGEAEGESEYGQRLVIDTILNRLDDSRFPDTISGVIYQENQFECMWNGRIERCEITEEMCKLVREELENRTNYDVMLFQMYNYSQWGSPLFKEGCHYFSSY